MSAEQSVTRWINGLRDGDGEAAERLWHLYFRNMVSLARQRLIGAPKRVADEEDVALSAFKSFCIGLQSGRFDEVSDRDNLWPLLVTITAHKAVDLVRHENRIKRGGTGERSAVDRSRVTQIQLDEVFAKEPTPDFVAQIAEQFHLLMDELQSADDPDLQRIAILKMEGDSNDEIAKQIECTRRTVERKIRIIASMWHRESDA